MGVCPDHKTQALLLRALTRKFKLEEGCDLDVVAQKCPLTLTGADLYALCTDANLKAIKRLIERVDTLVREWNDSGPHGEYPHPMSTSYYLDHIFPSDELQARVSLDDFVQAVKELSPSLTKEEIERYRRIREKFEPDVASVSAGLMGANTNTGDGDQTPKVDRKGKGKAV